MITEFVLKILFWFFMFAMGRGVRAALPLRPADATRLEGVSALSLAMVVIVAGVLRSDGLGALSRREEG